LSIAPHRLLGFAFASADLLVEIGADDRITFAVGAAAMLSGGAETSLNGRSWRDFVESEDHPVLDALFLASADRHRQGPVVVRLAAEPADGRGAFAISACRLPQNKGRISCALAPAHPLPLGEEPGGLHGRHGFETVGKRLFEAAQATGEDLELAFVEMSGLGGLAQQLPEDAGRALRTRLAGALRAQSHGGAAAAHLGDDRYALIHQAGESPQALTAGLAKLLGLVADIGDVRFAAKAMPISGDVSPSQMVRAMRYALDDFIRDGVTGEGPLTLQDAVNQSVRNTLEKASALGSAVAKRQFTLVFQPVVSLKNGVLHHHEVLVRFGDDASPFPMIRMAEELDLIEGLDLAIAEQATARLANDPKLKLAVNVSGRTITSPAFAPAIGRLLKTRKGVTGRLMFELTESAAIEDLALANRHIQALRKMGCEVCLDDFGAGAASLAYLQQLNLDLVKIDGRYIRELQHGGREATFIRHLVSMCAELGVKMLAEMVETPQVEDAVRQAGVDFGQGYLYGAPTPRPAAPPSRTGAAAARRMGVVETWG